MTRENFEQLVTQWVDRAKQSSAKAEKTSESLREFYVSDDLKELLKKAKMTAQEAQDKYNRVKKKYGSRVVVQYWGQWERDRRNGWGKTLFKNCDKYYG